VTKKPSQITFLIGMVFLAVVALALIISGCMDQVDWTRPQ